MFKRFIERDNLPALFTISYNDDKDITKIDIYSDVMKVHLIPEYLNQKSNVSILHYNYIYLNYGLIEKIANDLHQAKDNTKIYNIYDKIYEKIYSKHLEYIEIIKNKGYDY